MALPLATVDDLTDMWRPLAATEVGRAGSLLGRASALLRQVMPAVDDRIAQYRTDPASVGGLDPDLVATVVATVVKRFVSNVEGIASEGIGPYHVAYALRTEKDIRGELQITDADLRALRATVPRSSVGSIRVRPSLAPWPVGRLGASGVVASMFYDPSAVYEMGAEPVEIAVPVPIAAWDGEG